VDHIHILRRCRRPLVVFNALAQISISCFTPKIGPLYPLKLSVAKLRSRQKSGCEAPDFKERENPRFRTHIFQIALHFEHATGFGEVPFRFSDLRGHLTNKKKMKDRITVNLKNPKSANDYVGCPNKMGS